MTTSNLFDIHCHLTFPRFKEDLDDVISRAEKVGVSFVVCSGVAPSSNRDVLALSKKYPGFVKCSFGIYPIDAVANILPKSELSDDVPRDLEVFDYKEELRWIKDHEDDCVAIGEAGLDYSVTDDASRQKQRKIFSEIIDFAKQLNKPLIVHSRKGESDVLDILEKKNFYRVDLHCFTANKKLIKRGVELGFFFSVPAVITRLEHFRMLVSIVPLTQLLTETDAPYLAPTPGGRSEPSDVSGTVKIISQIKGLSENDVADQLLINAKKFLFFD